MTATDLTLSTADAQGEQFVYVRQLWTDSWEHVPGLHCLNMEFATLPSIGAAVLWRPFGLAMFSGEDHAEYKSALEIKNWFVKVVYVSNGPEGIGNIEWHGVAVIEDLQRGDRVTDPNTGSTALSGSQTFHCFELGYLLDRKPILNGYFTSTGDTTEIGAAPDFNANGVANHNGNAFEENLFRFAKLSGDGNATFWTTKKIVSYLLEFFTPQDGMEAGPVFTIEQENDHLQPDWDKPTLPQHGQSLWGVLGQVLDRRRGLGGFLYVRSIDNQVILKTFTHVASDLTLGDEDGNTLQANPTQYNLEVDQRPELGTAIKLSCADQYNRVIVEGRKRRVAATLEFAAADELGERDWTDDDEDAYNDGASSQADYAGLASDDLRRQANARVRNSAILAQTFKRFKIKDDWDGKTAAGISGGDRYVVFVDDAEEAKPEAEKKVYGNWPEGWRFLQALPLYPGIDYSGTNITTPYAIPEITDAETPFMPVMAFFPTHANSAAYFDVAGGAMQQTESVYDNLTWSARLFVEDEKARLWVDVIGKPQNMIAEDEFTGVSGAVEDDVSKPANPYDWKTMLATVCFEEPRRVRVQWPPDDITGAADVGSVREKYLLLGDGYCLDRVVPQTVLGISDKSADYVGKPLRSTSGGYVRDDRDKMRALASQLYDFYSKVRKAARIEKTGLTDELWLGDYIVQFGLSSDPSPLITEVGTVVTQIAIGFPEMAKPPVMNWETSHGELDALVIPVKRRGRR